MQVRHLGDSSLELPVITFGAWAIGGWMWGGADFNDAVEAILASYENGVTAIDTAPIYGYGRSEEIVGHALKSLPREKLQILTKFGLVWEGDKGTFYFTSNFEDGSSANIYKYGGKESIIRECEASLKRLGTDFIDLYQIHWPDDSTPVEESFEAVLRLKEQGKIREGGVCNYDIDRMKRANNIMPIASNQVPYSMIIRNIEEQVVPYCLQEKKGILAYSPLQRGLLTGKITPDYQFNEGDHRPSTRPFKPNNILKVNQMLAKIQPLADDLSLTLGQLVLAWTVHQPAITVALAGARNAKQAIENAKAGAVKLTTEQLNTINQALATLVLE